MPPKLSKKQEEEALKAQQDELKKKEEEEKQKQELLKYTVLTLPTGLELFITEYFFQEIQRHSQPFEFAYEYVKTFLKINSYIHNFKTIEIEVLVETILYDYAFAKENLQLKDQQLAIVINMLFSLYKYKNNKFTPNIVVEIHEFDFEERLEALKQPPAYKKTTRADKTKIDDQNYFKELCTKHSIDGDEQESMKVLNSSQLGDLAIYVNQSYFAHWNLIDFIQWNDQNVESQSISLWVHQPHQEQKDLENAIFLDLTEKTQIAQVQEEEIKEEKVEVEEEDELDAGLLAIIRERVKNSSEVIEERLKQRQKELEEKLQEQQNISKKKK